MQETALQSWESLHPSSMQEETRFAGHSERGAHPRVVTRARRNDIWGRKLDRNGEREIEGGIHTAGIDRCQELSPGNRYWYCAGLRRTCAMRID